MVSCYQVNFVIIIPQGARGEQKIEEGGVLIGSEGGE